MMAEQGQYPVLHLNLRTVKGNNFSECMQFLTTVMQDLIRGVLPLIKESALALEQVDSLRQLRTANPDTVKLQGSLHLLSQVLHQSQGRQVIILIDEYDVPLLEMHHANASDYRQMVDFYRGFFGAALKDNPHLKRGCLTGILRIARESIFSDLNNVIVYSLTKSKFNSCFGFTEPEVQSMLQSFSLADRLDEVRKWYNGYDFCGQTIYNPWSVLSFINDNPRIARPYWIGSSANQLVKQLVVEQGASIREQVSALLSGQTLQYPLNEHIALDEVGQSAEQIWNFLTFTGYLKPVGESYDELNNIIIYSLAIPNLEIRSFYAQSLSAWLRKNLEQASALQALLQALQNLDWPTLEQQLNTILRSNISYFDSGGGEAFYHALFIGMLLHLPGYRLQSNREAGLGRYDCQLSPQDTSKAGFIMEFKSVSSSSNFSKTLTAAQRQIRNRGYATDLQSLGVKSIYSIAVAVKGKQAKVRAQPVGEFRLT